MKPLLLEKVRRRDVAEPLNDWEAADDQLTDKGRAEFWKRQEARIEAAKKAREEASKRVVQPIRKVSK